MDNERPLTPEGIEAWIDQFSLPTQALLASGQEMPEQRLVEDLRSVHQTVPPMERSLVRVWKRLQQWPET